MPRAGEKTFHITMKKGGRHIKYKVHAHSRDQAVAIAYKKAGEK